MEATMREKEAAQAEVALYEFSFGLAGWERAYEAVVERIAFETAAKCTNSYDPTVYFDAVAATIFHPKAKSEIVRRFLTSACELANRELGLRLEFEMTRYDGEYGPGGTAYGRIDPHMTIAEIVDTVSAAVSAKCGTVARFEDDIGYGYLLDWYLECIEIADAREVDHDPEGEVAIAIAERLQQSGAVLECLRSAFDPNELARRLADLDRVAAEVKYRARAAHF
jgi:sugar phosphate isomerase/epimerase